MAACILCSRPNFIAHHQLLHLAVKASCTHTAPAGWNNQHSTWCVCLTIAIMPGSPLPLLHTTIIPKTQPTLASLFVFAPALSSTWKVHHSKMISPSRILPARIFSLQLCRIWTPHPRVQHHLFMIEELALAPNPPNPQLRWFMDQEVRSDWANERESWGRSE